MNNNDNTIFDDVLRTIMEKDPKLIIPLINKVFKTSYSEKNDIIQLRNEHINEDGKVITDATLLLGGVCYHIECQSNPDDTMVIRMFEYDIRIAIEDARNDGQPYTIRFPKSFVLYLRHKKQTEKFSTLNVVFPDGQQVKYEVPNMYLDDYDLDEIFEKELLALIPYYALHYEHKGKSKRKDGELEQMISDYKKIMEKLDSLEQENAGRSKDILSLLKRITDYIFQNDDDFRKGVDDIMGGQVLDVPSDALRKQHAEGRIETILEMVRDGDITMERASEKLGQTIDQVRQMFEQMFPTASMPD